MTDTAPCIEEMLQELLDRQRRADKRLEVVEAAIESFTRPTREQFAPLGAPADTVPLSKMPTPPLIGWPKRNSSTPLPPLITPQSVIFRKPTPALIPTPTPPIDAPGAVVAGAEVLASLDDVIWSVSLDGSLVYFLAGAAEKLFGQPVQLLRDRPGAWLESFPIDDRGRLLLSFRKLVDQDVFTLEHRIEPPGRAPRWVVTRGRVIRDADGHPLRIDGITADVSDRTRTERAIANVLRGVSAHAGYELFVRLVERLAIAADSRIALVATVDDESPRLVRTLAVWADGALVEPFEIPVHDGVGRDLMDGIPVHFPSRARTRLPNDALLALLRADTFASEPLLNDRGQVVGMLVVADDRAVRPALPDVHELVRAFAPRVAADLIARTMSPVPCPREESDQVACLQKKVHELEAQLQQARRLETIGRFVAGVAHDFNNLLTLICGNAELVCEGLAGESPTRDAAEQVAAAGTRAAALTRQLLVLARPVPAEPRPIDLNTVVRGAEKILRRLVGETLSLTVNLSPAVELVCADPVQVEQVLFNLVANARDAIGSNSGTVIVRTADAVIERDRPKWPANLPGGGYVALTVSDTGAGMTDEVKSRVFEPFFTTKSVEKGTGLGLSNVRDAVQRAGGHIEVESAIGWGTSFRVYWPKMASPMPETKHDDIIVLVTPSHVANGETVLLVEDDEPVRELARAALQQAGYRVLVAADADVAEERARLFAGPIALLISDVGLPRRDGVRLAMRLRNVRPELKVLYISGYLPPDPLPSAAHGNFLAKPYTPQRLLEVVRQTIGATAHKE